MQFGFLPAALAASTSASSPFKMLWRALFWSSSIFLLISCVLELGGSEASNAAPDANLIRSRENKNIARENLILISVVMEKVRNII